MISLKKATDNKSVNKLREGFICGLIDVLDHRLREDMAAGRDHSFFIAEDYIEAYNLAEEELDNILWRYSKFGWKTARCGEVLHFFRPEADMGWYKYDKVFQPQ